MRQTSVLVWTSESAEAAATREGLLTTGLKPLDRYFYGACNRGLPLNSDGVTCSGDCHPPQ